MTHTKESPEYPAWFTEGLVEWWGHRDDMADVFGKCHIVCFPSRYGEGVPKVLLEAAAMGRPIVTTDAPGCRDVVDDQHNGILVAREDVPALARALKTLISDSEKRSLFGSRGRDLAVKEFSLDRVVEQTMELYDRAK